MPAEPCTETGHRIHPGRLRNARPAHRANVDTPDTRCLYYRHRCSLAAMVVVGGGIRIQAGPVSAVRMPSSIAQLVKVDLDRRAVEGPIICHPRARVWTFLVQSDISASARRDEAELWRGRIQIAQPGQLVALPSPADRGGLYCGWIRAAHTPFRPSGLALVRSIRAVLEPFDAAEDTVELSIVGAHTAI